ncbi:MAG: flagellar export chaperone FliS [Defluviitaleaceae bacterium]|nr:flagellar export chaperone FliS [Defluviitaleaceae bacterium]
MIAANPYEKMIDNVVLTASKEELTLLLYEGAIKFCNQAMQAITKKDHAKAHELIIRTEDIIREFQITLDRQYEISKYFDTMYDYMYGRLVDANIAKDAAIVEEVRDLIREFRDTWKEAVKISRNN